MWAHYYSPYASQLIEMRSTTGAQWRRTGHAGRGDLDSLALAGETPANAHDARHATDTTGALICSPIRSDLIRRANFLDSSNIAGSVFLGEAPDTNALPVHQRNCRNSDAVRPVVDAPGSNSHNCNSDSGTTPSTKTLRMRHATHGYDSKKHHDATTRFEESQSTRLERRNSCRLCLSAMPLERGRTYLKPADKRDLENSWNKLN